MLGSGQIVARTGKLAYEWRGLEHLPKLLDRLVADQVGIAKRLHNCVDHCLVRGSSLLKMPTRRNFLMDGVRPLIRILSFTMMRFLLLLMPADVH
jgi:hypothetical protein